MRIAKLLRAAGRHIDNNIEEWVFGKIAEKVMFCVGFVTIAGLIFTVISAAITMR